MDNLKTGARIKSIRHSLGLTMREFGEKLSPSASDSLVSRWEKGVNLPNNNRLKQIANLGGTSVDYLLTGRETVAELKKRALTEGREEVSFFEYFLAQDTTLSKKISDFFSDILDQKIVLSQEEKVILSKSISIIKITRDTPMTEKEKSKIIFYTAKILTNLLKCIQDEKINPNNLSLELSEFAIRLEEEI